MKKNSLLGREYKVEYEADDGGTVWIRGFVAAYDVEKGMTIKAIDPDECPAWMGREEDGSVNLICFNLDKAPYHKKALPRFIEAFKGKKNMSIVERHKVAPPNPYCNQVSCNFS